jgi:L-threonylcarbamoyladenylate synthase
MIVSSSDPGCFTLLAEILLKNGVAVLKCDTIYGIIGIAPGTELRISKIKCREEEKPFLVLIPDTSWISRFSDYKIPPRIAQFWPGPLTVIIPSKIEGTIGIRVPADSFLKKILLGIDKPLYSTSVNIEGNPPLAKIADIIRQFEHTVDLIVDSGDVYDNTPSTIIDISTAPVRIIRQGKVIIPIDILLSIHEQTT